MSLLNNISHSWTKLVDKQSNLPFHSENGFPFKQITFTGMNIYFNEKQPLKTPFPMLVTLSGMTMLDRELQFLNALLPILVTLSGMTMLDRE